MSLDSGQGGRAAYVRLSLCLRGGKSSKSVRGGAGYRRRAAKNSTWRWKSRGSKGRSATFTTAQDLGMAGGAHGLAHFEDTLAYTVLADLVVGPHQLERLALDQGVFFLLERGRGLAETFFTAARHRPARQGIGGHFVEKVGDRHVQHLREFEEPARSDAVGAALVLLNLLEGETDGCPELLLAHAEKSTPLAHTRTHMNIDRM